MVGLPLGILEVSIVSFQVHKRDIDIKSLTMSNQQRSSGSHTDIHVDCFT